MKAENRKTSQQNFDNDLNFRCIKGWLDLRLDHRVTWQTYKVLVTFRTQALSTQAQFEQINSVNKSKLSYNKFLEQLHPKFNKRHQQGQGHRIGDASVTLNTLQATIAASISAKYKVLSLHIDRDVHSTIVCF